MNSTTINVMAASALLFMGQFSLFTYVRPFLETVTDVHGSDISLYLLVLGAAGFIGTALIGRWIARIFPKDAEAGGGLFVAVVQLSIALGSTVGGLLFDHSGYRATFIASAVMLLICALLTFVTARSQAGKTG